MNKNKTITLFSRVPPSLAKWNSPNYQVFQARFIQTSWCTTITCCDKIRTRRKNGLLKWRHGSYVFQLDRRLRDLRPLKVSFQQQLLNVLFLLF